MDETQKPDAAGQPQAEVLAPRAEQPATTVEAQTAALPKSAKDGTPQHRRIYRPSHRATFIGLAAIAAVLLINAVIIGLVIRSQSKDEGNGPTGQVTVSQDALDRLGVNRDPLGSSGIELTVTPNTEFKGSIVVGRDLSIAGKLKLNGAFSATTAQFGQLQASDAKFNKLEVSGDTTISALTIPKDLVVSGTTRLQGAVTATQLVTINNSLNVGGNLSVGGTISVDSLNARTVTVVSTLIIGGHVISSGSRPGVAAGPTGSSTMLGSNGTATISGNDHAGTVAFNVGANSSGSGPELIATITFHSSYAITPHVVITPIGRVASFYVSRSSSGFNIYAMGFQSDDGFDPGGYAFDYIVVQ